MYDQGKLKKKLNTIYTHEWDKGGIKGYNTHDTYIPKIEFNFH